MASSFSSVSIKVYINSNFFIIEDQVRVLETKLETALLTGRTIEEKLAVSEKAQAQLKAELE